MIIQPNFKTHEYDPKKVLKVKSRDKQKLYSECIHVIYM